MNLLGEFIIKKGEEEIVAKLTLGALYRTQTQMKLRGLLDIVGKVQELDLELVQVVFANMQTKIKKDEILDLLNLPEALKFLSEALVQLMQPKETKKGNE